LVVEKEEAAVGCAGLRRQAGGRRRRREEKARRPSRAGDVRYTELSPDAKLRVLAC